MKKLYFIALISSLILVLGACSSGKKEGRPLNDFTFTDQDNNKLGLEDLKGKVWVADFVFTNCATICPPMTTNMSQLQSDVKEAGLKDVHFVSFSVDPEIDTPQALKDYGEKFGADFSTWHFLTGYSQKDIEDFAVDNFKTLVKKPQNDNQVIHGTTFFLINKDGEVIEEYQGNVDVPFKQIVKDIKSASKAD